MYLGFFLYDQIAQDTNDAAVCPNQHFWQASATLNETIKTVAASNKTLNKCVNCGCTKIKLILIHTQNPNTVTEWDPTQISPPSRRKIVCTASKQLLPTGLKPLLRCVPSNPGRFTHVATWIPCVISLGSVVLPKDPYLHALLLPGARIKAIWLSISAFSELSVSILYDVKSRQPHFDNCQNNL